MSSAPRPEVTLSAAIGRRVVPALVLIMLSVTGIAVVLGCLSLAGTGVRGATLFRAYFWVVFWTGLAEGVSLLAGCLLVRHLGRRIARPISNLAARADHLTSAGGVTVFPTDAPLREVNQLAAAFNRLFAVQERRTREVRDLATHVLHDIKTPLTRIRNQAERVFRGRADAREASRDIADACSVILGLVNMNAEISRVYAGVEPSPAEPVDLSALLADVLDLYSGVADEKRIAVSVSQPDVRVSCPGHPSRLQGLLVNLLDNALKYTPPGGAVAVSLAQTPDGVVLRVSDTGPGIPADALPHIYERFYRADPSRHEPGFGLGLALVHAVATSYRGTVACDTVPGRGATFTVVLPAASAAARRPRPDGSAPSPSDGSVRTA